MSPVTFKTMEELREYLEFYFENIKSILKNHNKPSEETIKKFEELKIDINERVSESLFYKAVGGSIVLALTIGLSIIGANYRIMTGYLDLYEKNFVTKAEYLDGIEDIKGEIASLRNDYEIVTLPQ